MTIPLIPQPYVVFHQVDNNRHAELTEWMLKNVDKPFYAVSGPVLESGQQTLFRLAPPADDSLDWQVEGHTRLSLFMFECPRDAMLFKLTWGGF